MFCCISQKNRSYPESRARVQQDMVLETEAKPQVTTTIAYARAHKAPNKKETENVPQMWFGPRRRAARPRTRHERVRHKRPAWPCKIRGVSYYALPKYCRQDLRQGGRESPPGSRPQNHSCCKGCPPACSAFHPLISSARGGSSIGFLPVETKKSFSPTHVPAFNCLGGRRTSRRPRFNSSQDPALSTMRRLWMVISWTTPDDSSATAVSKSRL